jgi:hypothetical protein
MSMMLVVCLLGLFEKWFLFMFSPIVVHLHIAVLLSEQWAGIVVRPVRGELSRPGSPGSTTASPSYKYFTLLFPLL